MFRQFCISIVALAACNGGGKQAEKAPTPIEVRDAQGVVAELLPIRPCRAKVGNVEMIVGGPPILSQVGETRWMGATGSNGTTYQKDGERIARLFPAADPNEASVLDTRGVALMRVMVTGETAKVTNAASIPVRNVKREGSAISVDEPALTVTGTDDLVLAALLSAPELSPEVRMLAACERVLVKGS